MSERQQEVGMSGVGLTGTGIRTESEGEDVALTVVVVVSRSSFF